MRNVWLIIRREYLERVRTKSFIISTLLLPAFMFGVTVLPSKLAMMKGGTRHIVVAAPTAELAETVESELQKKPDEKESSQGAATTYTIDADTSLTESERGTLRDKVSNGEIDGFLWLDPTALESRKVSYYGRETSDFVEQGRLERAVRTAIMRQRLAAKGVDSAELDTLLKDVDLQAVSIKAGKETKAGGVETFLSTFLLVMLLYMTLLLYGVAVMRSVVEEKNSRVMEVMLSSCSAKEMMAGKILGVCAAGVTQILIWAVLAAVVAGQAAAVNSVGGSLNIPAGAFPAFAVFFFLGFLLYSSLYAALGAMVNSDQEAQQWQWFVVMPIVVPMIMITYVIRQPNSPVSFWMSLVPFFSPILMYLRIIVQTPPWWQIALSVGLLVATVWCVVVLCSRVYRIGILMYGKRPTLPEIVKWLKYA